MAEGKTVVMTLEYEDEDHIRMSIKKKPEHGGWEDEYTVVEAEENGHITSSWPHIVGLCNVALTDVLKEAQDIMGA